MIFSSYPYWWLALPLLLLPWWWHRQKRQRLTAEPLATARFLPAAEPQQLRIWQWRDRLLLLVRCLLLIVLLAWLAATIVPWRGDTVLLDKGADPVWAQQQIAAAGMGHAQQLELPAQPLRWLAEHEREWRATARLLVVSRDQQLAMPARPPQFAHAVTLRTMAGTASGDQAPPPGLAIQEVVLATTPERLPLWRAMFAAFASVGADQAKGGLAVRFVDTPGPATSLIIWDRPDPAPARWSAPHWWLGTARVHSEKAAGQSVSLNGLRLQYADTAQGRIWTSDAFPPRDAEAAYALYQSWQQLQPAAATPYGLTSQQWSATPATGGRAAEAEPARWLAYVLLALLMIERVLSHARRN
ncbi:BatA domain-containing protein [Pseudoduganella danionis]|uniref:BatA domain-containing protein n=1 Tax=Pseudoduganella danionis TaxID=1890295 RepID=UPI0012D45F15|nr:BatA domain-containing protein [Pseudoduganella danionis]